MIAFLDILLVFCVLTEFTIFTSSTPASQTLNFESADLPHLGYRYSSFAVPNPYEAVEFVQKYMNGFILKKEDFLTQPLVTYPGQSEITGFRIPYNGGEDFADLYFVKETGLPEHPSLNLDIFIQKLQLAHTFSQDDWDWWQDWHIAYHVDDLDAVATRLNKDGVPFVTRSISFYFEIPGTSVIIQILGEHNYFWSTPFAFCRHTGDNTTRYLPRYDQNVTDIDALPYPPTLPEFVPSHQSWAVSDTLRDFWWTAQFLPTFVPIDMTDVFNDTHQHANGTCAQIGWMSDTGYNTMDGKGWAIHYIEQFVKRQGDLPVSWVENTIKETRSEFGTEFKVPDAYMGFRTAFACSRLEPFIELFERENEPFLIFEGRMFVQTPSGIVFELYEEPE